MSIQVAPQKGVALITAILVVSLATIAATAIYTKQQLNLRRTENLVHSDQAYMFALGAEQWASQFLLKDKDMNVDHTGEDWAMPLPPIPVEGGTIGGFITDATSGFPLNSLVDSAGVASPYHVKVFRNLTDQLFENNPAVANLLVDWMDKNSDVTLGGGGSGAEDTDYQNLQHHPFRAANRPMASVSELMLVLRLSEDAANLRNDYAALFPKSGSALVNTLPQGAKININTAPAIILNSLAMAVTDVDQNMAKEVVDEIMELKDKDPLTTINPFIEKITTRLQAKLKNPTTNPNGNLQETHQKDMASLKELLSSGSTYYLVQSQAKIGRIEMVLLSLVKRELNKVTTLRRGLGTL